MHDGCNNLKLPSVEAAISTIENESVISVLDTMQLLFHWAAHYSHDDRYLISKAVKLRILDETNDHA